MDYADQLITSPTAKVEDPHLERDLSGFIN
jgi:hypothetical protein